MSCSSSLFDISNGPLLENTFQARLLCVKDFLKRLAFLPLALLYKAYKTISRAIAVCFGAALVAITVGSSPAAREFFLERVASLAKDLADWILMPFALFARFFKLLVALFIHPNLYFNSLF